MSDAVTRALVHMGWQDKQAGAASYRLAKMLRASMEKSGKAARTIDPASRVKSVKADSKLLAQTGSRMGNKPQEFPELRDRAPWVPNKANPSNKVVPRPSDPSYKPVTGSPPAASPVRPAGRPLDRQTVMQQVLRQLGIGGSVAATGAGALTAGYSASQAMQGGQAAQPPVKPAGIKLQPPMLVAKANTQQTPSYASPAIPRASLGGPPRASAPVVPSPYPFDAPSYWIPEPHIADSIAAGHVPAGRPAFIDNAPKTIMENYRTGPKLAPSSAANLTRRASS